MTEAEWEVLREEFERLYVHKGEDSDDPPDKWTWTIQGSFPIEVWAWITNHFHHQAPMKHPSKLYSCTIHGLTTQEQSLLQEIVALGFYGSDVSEFFRRLLDQFIQEHAWPPGVKIKLPEKEATHE